VSVGSFEQFVDGPRVDQSSSLGFLQRANDCIERDEGCKVKERPREADGWDAVHRRGVLPSEGRAVEGDARPASTYLAHGGDIDSALRCIADAPQCRCRPMAEHGARATGKDGRQPVPSPLDHAVAHGVNTAMKEVKAPGREAPVDRPVTQAQREELPPRDHPVLPAGQLGHDIVGGSVLFTTV